MNKDEIDKKLISERDYINYEYTNKKDLVENLIKEIDHNVSDYKKINESQDINGYIEIMDRLIVNMYEISKLLSKIKHIIDYYEQIIDNYYNILKINFIGQNKAVNKSETLAKIELNQHYIALNRIKSLYYMLNNYKDTVDKHLNIIMQKVSFLKNEKRLEDYR
ncbi:MAG: hypothetical protein KatS3mg096_640 [Candidatus Parcubacteria bacterium]|nr:MAG: hypothetical protein KatS3mg096_640 [Candidatus Parcubacteria bacterium]